MTWHVVWQLTEEAAERLRERAGLGLALEALARFPLATWTRYTLGGVGVSRPMDLARLQLDAMTQRTQAIALLDEAAGHRAMFDLGKQRGAPSALIACAAPATEAEARALERFLEACVQAAPARRVAALSADGAPPAPLPRLERAGAWDWLGPELLDVLGPVAWDTAPAPAQALARGRLLRAGGDAWWRAAPGAAAQLDAWWRAQLGA